MYENKCLQYWSGVPTVNVHCRYRLLLPVASTCSSIANSVEQTAMPGATAFFILLTQLVNRGSNNSHHRQGGGRHHKDSRSLAQRRLPGIYYKASSGVTRLHSGTPCTAVTAWAHPQAHRPSSPSPRHCITLVAHSLIHFAL